MQVNLYDCYIIFFKALLKRDNIPLFYLSEQVWDRIAPGLASEFDSPSSIPAIAPRPLLIVNGENPFLNFNQQERIFFMLESVCSAFDILIPFLNI